MDFSSVSMESGRQWNILFIVILFFYEIQLINNIILVLNVPGTLSWKCWWVKKSTQNSISTENILHKWRWNVFRKNKAKIICHQQTYTKINAIGHSLGWGKMTPGDYTDLQEPTKNIRKFDYLDKYKRLCS